LTALLHSLYSNQSQLEVTTNQIQQPLSKDIQPILTFVSEGLKFADYCSQSSLMDSQLIFSSVYVVVYIVELSNSYHFFCLHT